MTRTDARILMCGLIPDGFNAARLTPKGRDEVRAAIDKLLELCHDPLMDEGASLALRVAEISGKAVQATPIRRRINEAT